MVWPGENQTSLPSDRAALSFLADTPSNSSTSRSSSRTGSAAGTGDQCFGDLDGVEGRALAEVVVADEEGQPVFDRGVATDATDVGGVAASGLERGGHVDHLDPRRGLEELDRPL